MKQAAILLLLLLSSCRATQVLTTDAVTSDSMSRQQLERVLSVTLAADGRTATVHELATYTDHTRRETTRARQAPAPAAPWYDRWARWIAVVAVLVVGLTIYLKFFSPLRLL